ncbi:MAG: hypothetical protein ABIG63_14375 [Chloroflexota bacterium]
MNLKNRWLVFLSPERSIVRYVVGTAALTVVIQVIYDQITTEGELIGAYILAAALFVAVLLLFWLDASRTKKETTIDVDVEPINPHKGIIILVSPGNLYVPWQIIEHHQSALTHIWLLSTLASMSTANELLSKIKNQWPRIRVHSLEETIVDADNIERTWEMVEKIYSVWAPDLGLQPCDVVSDITGGTKMMTAGMTLACASPERNMEYVYTPRELKDGTVKEHAPRVLVKIST